MGDRHAQKHRRAGKGAILLLAFLLVSSAVLRLGIGVGTALADATKDGPTVAEAENPPEIATAQPKTRAELGRLLDALTAREERLRKQERAIEMRTKALEVADKEISKRMRNLEQVEADLRQTLSLANGAAEGDLTQLTNVYENMKAKDAAAVFEAMDPPFAAGFLARMRPDTAAAIMAGLTPEVAYTISVILAGRNAKAPKT